MSKSGILLKPVGKMPNSQKKILTGKRSIFEPLRSYDGYDGQITPSQILINQNEQKNKLNPQKKFYITKHNKEKNQDIKFNLIQDPRQSQFSYRKYILIQKILMILTIFSFIVAIVNTQMFVIQSSLSQNLLNSAIQADIISSILTILLSMYVYFIMIVIATFMRYVCMNQLEIDQKRFYCVRKGEGILYEIYRFIKYGHNLKTFLIEVILILPHPFFMFHTSLIQIFQTYNQIMLKHRVNDILTIISLNRVYIIMRALVNLTIYSTPRASRLCSHNRVQHSFLYTIKCLLKQQPVKIISLMFLLQEIVLGFGLKLSQGSLIYSNPDITETGFQNYINCYWCVFITMATVGYGDYFPKTLPGRVVGLIAAASGIILSSLLIVSLSAYLTMQSNQSKSHLTLVRLHHQEQLKKQATQALIQTMRLSKYLSNQQKSGDNKIKDFFIKLKHKIDIVKFRSRKIKSLVNNNNMIQQMNRLFQLFKDNLQESFRNQVKLKEELQKLAKNTGQQRKMQTIFLTHNMEEIITKKL